MVSRVFCGLSISTLHQANIPAINYCGARRGGKMKYVKLIALVSLAIPVPALADWQPTKWGMSVDQVIKATGNRAKANTDSDAESDELLTMPYTQTGLHFTAYFEFDEDTKLLTGVKLEAENRDCENAFKMLKSNYGAPASSLQGIAGDMEKWQDTSGSNRITALALPSRSKANYCSITFRSLPPAAPARS